MMDAVHKAAFRGFLGRSLYMSPDRVGSFSTKAVSRSPLLQYGTVVVVVVLYMLSCFLGSLLACLRCIISVSAF